MQEGEAYEKWSVLLAHINIIYSQTGFFVETTIFWMQDFGYSRNLLRYVPGPIFRAEHEFFRSHVDALCIFVHPTNIQNPAWLVRRDGFRDQSTQRCEISHMSTSRRSFACCQRDRSSWMRTETPKNTISRYFCCVFFTTGRTIFFSGMRRTALWRLQGREFKISRKCKFFREQRQTGTANFGIWRTCFL